jgi:hypothetical protein
MVRAWDGRGMTSVNQTRPHCVNQMGKTHSKTLAARHGRETVWARHGHGMLCVNRPLAYFVNLYIFRAYLGQSSGGTTIYIQQMVFIILFRQLLVQETIIYERTISTNCCIHTVVPPDDAFRYARNR